MAKNSSIEWTDHTWNPLTGCSVCSPGCRRCYAMRLAGTRLKHHPSREGLTIDTPAGPVWNGKVRYNEQWLDEPLRIRKPSAFFVCAHSDLFHKSVPNWQIDSIIAIMALARHHTFQVLTKRSDRMKAYFWDGGAGGWCERVLAWVEKLKPSDDWNGSVWQARHDLSNSGFLPNVWLGVSAEDQKRLDERVPHLLATPAAKRYVSIEPMVGPITFEGRFIEHPNPMVCINWLEELDGIIVGGESGHDARPLHPEWAYLLRDQAEACEAGFMFKQWGSWVPVSHLSHDDYEKLYFPAPKRDPEATRRCRVPQTVFHPDGHHEDFYHKGAMLMFNVGKGRAGRLLDGVEHNWRPA